jgi:hypothetical protein
VHQRALPHQEEPSSAGYAPDCHPSWRPPAMGVLSAIGGSPLCNPAFSQVARDRRGSSNALYVPADQRTDRTPQLRDTLEDQFVASKAMGLPVGAAAPSSV